jgi:hypothetical protein
MGQSSGSKGASLIQRESRFRYRYKRRVFQAGFMGRGGHIGGSKARGF